MRTKYAKPIFTYNNKGFAMPLIRPLDSLLTVNETRADAKLPPLPWGDSVLWSQLGAINMHIEISMIMPANTSVSAELEKQEADQAKP